MEKTGIPINLNNTKSFIHEIFGSEAIENTGNVIFEALFTNSHLISFIVESETGKIIRANNAACNFYGYTLAEFEGMLLNHINILSLDEIKTELEAARNLNRNYFIFKHKLKSGLIKEVEVYSAPIQINGHKYLYSVVHDITERVKTDLLNNILKRSLDNYTDGIYSMDSENRFVYVNEAGGKAFGCSPNDLIGKSLQDVNPTTTPESLSNLWHVLRTRGIYTAETVHRRFDGSEFHVEIRTMYFVYQGKEYNIGYARDITERKQFEKELILSKEKAEESDRLKTCFLQNMSHEIRTPMNAIMGFASLLPQNYNNQSKLNYYSDIITQRCEDLLDIINDILDISKIESGQHTVNKELCNIEMLFNEIRDFFTEHQVRLKKQNISFDILNRCNKPILITTDVVKLRQIFINLISNAFKFTESGSISAGCHYNENGTVQYFVTDTGIGIPPDKFSFIFERFAQVENSNTKIYGGSGLGLSIVKGMVSLLGGNIWVESEIGKGSTFYFTLGGA